MAFQSVGIIVAVAAAVLMFDVSEGCNSHLDCQANECCVTNNQLIGKRMLLIVQGHCQPLGKEGSHCLTRYGSVSSPPTGVVHSCPCGAHLTCKGSGLIEVPFGETGICTHQH
ncbi:prokineticin-1-like [Mizuhopecten yessoensis]|uniref:prokineticin-1-like n=1 Tax=Mizuhopecten yessoensis TaxID=6573 RepID=UPI000B457721|nr:prokineticin-1-like [Mizuhopecten yessoensis]